MKWRCEILSEVSQHLETLGISPEAGKPGQSAADELPGWGSQRLARPESRGPGEVRGLGVHKGHR